MPADVLTFGPFVLDAAAGTLLRQGVPVPVGYRGFLLLRELAAHAGELVPKTALMDAAWPNMAIEEANLSVQIAALRKLLGAHVDGTDWITNVPRIGYRLNAPVASTSSSLEQTSELGPSIAVLPFESLSADTEQAYFADGLTEDLITRLARLRWLFVAARNSSFGYKSRRVEPGQVGRDLQVRYVLEGSVRSSAARLRINSQLSDTTTGRQVWAESYDVEVADFFTLQDEISEAVIAAIEPRLYAAEYERFKSRPPESLDAWGFVMKAMPLVWTWGSPDDIAAAQSLLFRALTIDPDYPRAKCLLAWTVAAQVQLGHSDAARELPYAVDLAQQAISHAADDPWTHFAAGYVHMVARRTDAALEALNEAIDLNPSFALAHIIFASSYAYAGRGDEGLHHLSLAERMSPRDSSQSAIYSTQATCHFVEARYVEAVSLGRRSVQLRPNFGTAWRTLAASSGMASDFEFGKFALAQAKRLQPSLSLDWVRLFHPIVRQADLDRYVAGLRAVGLE